MGAHVHGADGQQIVKCMGDDGRIDAVGSVHEPAEKQSQQEECGQLPWIEVGDGE